MPASFDPYRVLGVDPTATTAEIRQAYRRAVHAAHADRRPGDPAAVARMQAILAARDLLCDPERRARHDAARSEAAPPPLDPLSAAAARMWGQSPGEPSRPPRPPQSGPRPGTWLGATLAGVAGLAAALGLSLAAAAALTSSARAERRR